MSIFDKIKNVGSKIGSGLGSGFSAIAPGLISGGISAISSAGSAYKAYKYSKKLQQHQYDLNQRSLRESPSAFRQGYVDAGYNPLLALDSSGMGFNASAGQSPSENIDGSSVVNSAIAYRQGKANVENIKANSALAREQAETERAKRVQMDFQNAMTDVETHLKQKDLSSYDKRFYQEIYESMQRAENYRANSAVARMNAETERMNAHTNRLNVTEGNPFKLGKTLVETSDPYRWASRTYRKYFPKKG